VDPRRFFFVKEGVPWHSHTECLGSLDAECLKRAVSFVMMAIFACWPLPELPETCVRLLTNSLHARYGLYARFVWILISLAKMCGGASITIFKPLFAVADGRSKLL
jgi:hypothetical protein